MILGRSTNVWTGFISAAVATLITIIGVLATPEVAQQAAIILGAVGAFLGVLVLFIANQAPTLQPGDTFTVQTPKGQPNYQTTVAPPPASDPAPTPITAPQP
jgi:hypothetical protein